MSVNAGNNLESVTYSLYSGIGNSIGEVRAHESCQYKIEPDGKRKDICQHCEPLSLRRGSARGPARRGREVHTGHILSKPVTVEVYSDNCDDMMEEIKPFIIG